MLSRIDFCNSLLFGISNDLLSRLQKLQNAAARVVCKTPKHSHITPVLQSLHWLPIEARIHFKILTLVFRCRHGLAPPYLSEMLSTYTPARSLRSQNQDLLSVPQLHLKHFGHRSFKFAAPTLWNSLPPPIKNSPSLSVSNQASKLTSSRLSISYKLSPFHLQLNKYFYLLFIYLLFFSLFISQCSAL